MLSLYVTALVLVYQFVEWQYRLSPPLSLFLRSYLVKQVTVVCAAIVLILHLLGRLMRPAERAASVGLGPDRAAPTGPPARKDCRRPPRPRSAVSACPGAAL